MTKTRKITLQFPSLRAFLAEYGERISAEGMLLRSEAPPAAGSEVEVEVVVAAGMRLLRARGETLWSGAGAAGGGQPAAAVRFLDLDEASRKLIEKIIDQQRRGGAEPFRLADVPGPREARLLDLTMPAAAIADEPAEPARASADAIFDLAEAPAARPADLFEPAAPSGGVAAGPQPPAAERPAPEGSAPEPPAAERPAREPVFEEPPAPVPPVVQSAAARPSAPAPASPVTAATEPPALEPAPERKPKAPVPLLADPEPDPFDLGPPPPGVEAAPDSALGQPPAGDGQDGALAAADLDNLFDGDEPQKPPARGRTEAFPPSFVDEVEAELRAVEEPDSSFLDVDTSELELELGGPLTDPEAAPEPPREAAPAPPSAPAVESSGGSEPEPEIEIDLEIEDLPSPTREPESAPAVEAELAPAVEAAPTAAPEPAPEPESAAVPESPPEPAPLPEQTPEPVPPSDLAPGPDLAARVAQAFDATRGHETVEIPILSSPRASEAPSLPPVSEAPVPPPPSEAPSPPPALLDSAPPEVAEPPSPLPAIPGPSGSELAAPPDDNLLSIAELRSEPPAPSAAPEAPAAAPAAPIELPTSTHAVRGAAGRSRHLGTWLLIALLAGALAVAGYFLWGLSRDGGIASVPVESADAPTAPPERPAALPSAPTEQPDADAEGDAEGEDAAPSPSIEEAGRSPEVDSEISLEAPEPAPDAAATVEPAESETPLTGLDRITWIDQGSETLLSLVADGAIARSSVELVPIGGAQPRLVLKIAGVRRAFQPAVLEVGSGQVERVRTGLHAGGELHVVIDLAAAGVAVRDLEVRGGRVELRLGTE